jgi:hypothetical protein
LTPNKLRDVFTATLERWQQCLEVEKGQAELYWICYSDTHNSFNIL